MGYVESNLMSQEQVLHKGDIHWFVYFPGTFLMSTGVMLLVDSGPGPSTAPLGVMAIFIALVLLLKAFLFKISTEVAVTSKRVIAKMGFIRRSTVELNHQKVESLNVDQSIAGRLFGFGTIIVNGTGGGRTPIPSISDPLAFRRKTMEIIDATQSPLPQEPPPEKPTHEKPTIAPKKPTNWLGRGRRYLENGEYKEAVAALSNAITSSPNNGDIYYLRAVAYSKLSDKNKAITDIQQAANLGNAQAVEQLNKMKIK